jgi:probable HAF family extracellular repeat protein
MTDLGTIDGFFSESLALNNTGQVVGVLFTPGGSTEHAFLDSSGTMTDLNNLISAGSGYTLDSAHGITNDAVIAADAFDSAGRFHAVLMTPGSAPLSLASSPAAAAALNPATPGPFAPTDVTGQRHALGSGSIMSPNGTLPAASRTLSGGQPSLTDSVSSSQVRSLPGTERQVRDTLFAASGGDHFWASPQTMKGHLASRKPQAYGVASFDPSLVLTLIPWVP